MTDVSSLFTRHSVTMSVAATATATATASPIAARPAPGVTAAHQYCGDDERLVGQRLRDVNVQTGGIHCQGVIGVPDPDLRESTEEKVRRGIIKGYWWINNAL